MIHKIIREKGGLSTRRFCFRVPKRDLSKDSRDQENRRTENHMDNWTVERQNTFTDKYGDIALLLPIKIDEQLLKAIILF